MATSEVSTNFDEIGADIPFVRLIFIATSSIGTAFAANFLFLPALIIRLGSTVPPASPERRP
ncbi:MAG: hypothetical protein E6J77_00400 [Deltaproteobacteria bacterium]|nr:MAG: hypothetical protein E6J77_00400 [Deltaproteobacteria bacterium]